jgi:hypothetical protein
MLLSKGYREADLCRILPHIFSSDTSDEFLNSRISTLGKIFLMALIAGKRVIALISVNRKATTWHHYCEINSTEPH